MPDTIQWMLDGAAPPISLEGAIAQRNEGPLREIKEAFAEGVLVEYERQCINGGDDVEIRLVLRHRSKITPNLTEHG